jgi:hypothetical protein
MSSRFLADSGGDDEPFGSQNPNIIPFNPIGPLAWKGFSHAEVQDYLNKALETPSPPTAQKLLIHPTGLAGGSAAAKTVFVRTPHAGVARGAGEEVQTVEKKRITQASGPSACALTLMPAASIAAISYIKNGKALIHTAYADSEDEEEEQVIATHRTRKGKARDVTPFASPPPPLPPVKATTSRKAKGKRRARGFTSTDIVLDDDESMEMPEVSIAARRGCRGAPLPVDVPVLAPTRGRPRSRTNPWL